MPIKFRCIHCRQFLGISHAKAGCVVDCPTCGRSVRVPPRDGHAEAVPDPKIDLQDSALADALNEVSLIGQAAFNETASDPEEAESQQSSGIIKTIAPAPTPEPIELDPVSAAEPVSFPESPVETQSSSAHPAAVTATLTVEEDVLLEPVVREHELPTAAPLSLQERQQIRRASRSNNQSGGWWFALILGVILLTAGAGGIGYMYGTQQFADNQSGGRDPSNTNPRNGTSETNTTLSANVTSAFKGQITFKTEEGISKPDANARVLLFPQTREGQVKLPVAGFRTADSEHDFRTVTAAFKSLGGNVAIVDAEGNFETFLPTAGAYHILVLSNHLSREDTEPIPDALRELLANYFDRPDSLLGHVQFYYGQVRYQADKTEPWYYSFDQN